MKYYTFRFSLCVKWLHAFLTRHGVALRSGMCPIPSLQDLIRRAFSASPYHAASMRNEFQSEFGIFEILERPGGAPAAVFPILKHNPRRSRDEAE